MKAFEILVTIFNCAILMLNIITLLNSKKQMLIQQEANEIAIQSLNNSIKINFSFQRRIETEKRLAQFREIDMSDLKKNSKLAYEVYRNKSQIPLQVIIDEVFLKNSSHEIMTKSGDQLYNVLNFFESLIRGINQGTYDKEVIMRWGRNRMLDTIYKYYLFIKDRQKNDRKKVWLELSIWYENEKKIDEEKELAELQKQKNNEKSPVEELNSL